MISCLTITSLDRIHLLSRCFESFANQSLSEVERELVVIHHDGEVGSETLLGIARDYGVDARVIAVRQAPLGALRNWSIHFAKGDVLCQWDDDDFYHPDRLKIQYQAFQADRYCVATTLKMQMYWDELRNELYIRRGAREGIHGTIMFRRNLAVRYDASRTKGEDSIFIREVLDAPLGKVLTIDDRPELYVRRFHGKNTWSQEHHRELLKCSSLDAAWLTHHQCSIRHWVKIHRLPTLSVRDSEQTAFVC